MGDNLWVIQYFQPKSKISKIKEREPNPFFLYRDKKRETEPKNIKMTELSKIASDSWKKCRKKKRLNGRNWRVEKTLWSNKSSITESPEKPIFLFRILSNYFQSGQDVESTTVDVPNVVSVTSTLCVDTHQHYSNNSNPEVYATMDQLSQTYQHNMAIIDVNSTDDILLLYRPKWLLSILH